MDYHILNAMSLRDTSWIKFSNTSTANQYLQEKTGTQLGQIWQQLSEAFWESILQKTPSSTARRSLLNGKRSWITTMVRYPILACCIEKFLGCTTWLSLARKIHGDTELKLYVKHSFEVLSPQFLMNARVCWGCDRLPITCK